MGEADSRRLIRPHPRPLAHPLPPLRRVRPRAYLEWRTLRRWGRLPRDERGLPGYLLRLARERAGLTQRQLAQRLGRTQQAVSQAERWESNPTVAFMREWARATGQSLVVDLAGDRGGRRGAAGPAGR